MSCSGVQIYARRNADIMMRYVSQSRNYNFDGMSPILSIRQGPVTVLTVSNVASVNGSMFQVVNGEAVLKIDNADVVILASGVPVTERVSFSYDIIFRDIDGFDNWILGGEFIVRGLNELGGDGDCGGCGDGSVEISVGGQCLAVSISGGTIGMIGDAPSDGTLYGRMDGTWVGVPPASGGGLPDAPYDGTTYGRRDYSWVDLDVQFLADAPSDGSLYGRQDGAWETINLSGYITDAPSDGQQYAREDGAWSVVSIPAPTPPPPFSIGANVNPPLTDAEVLFTYVFIEPVTFAADWSGSSASVVAVPTAATTYTVKHKSVSGTVSNVGAVVYNTDGSFVFSTVGGVSVSFAAGEAMIFEGQAVADVDAACAITFKGVR